MIDQDPYPVTIIADRYGGCYSGAKWLAFNRYSDRIPDDVGAGDTDEMNFWYKREETALPLIGKGATPTEAFEHLKRMINEM